MSLSVKLGENMVTFARMGQNIRQKSANIHSVFTAGEFLVNGNDIMLIFVDLLNIISAWWSLVVFIPDT